jgi:YesN/AraC family two-component response regulator
MIEVLLVEDEEVIRKGLKKLVEEVIQGFRVAAEAANGRQALEYLMLKQPDLLVTDIRMGDMTGLDLIKRAREHYPALPILIISGYDDFEYAKQALRYGVADYLLKPVDRLELAMFLNRLKQLKHADNPTEPVKTVEDKESRQIIRRVKELIHQRLDQSISLHSVAVEVNFNPKYLSDLFKAKTGQSFSDFVTEVRMSRACQLLKETNLKIYEIAVLCGYSNAKHFTVAFKQHTGLSPTEYRN